jgi:hypothetical protein
LNFRFPADCVEKVGLEVAVVTGTIRREDADARFADSGCSGERRCGDQLCEFAQVLGGGCEMEFIAGAVRPA